MKRKKLPSCEYLHGCFQYREDGQLVWKKRPVSHFARPHGRHDFEGLIAGSIDAHNRVVVAISGKKYYVHCIIWSMFNGELPDDSDVDHEDGDTLNNKIGNLRLASGSQNNWNAQTPSHNRSGVKGVSWNSKTKGWDAAFQVFGVRIRVGSFKDIESARIALEAKRLEVCKEFTNHGVHKHVS